jgi:hypothetical protein|tara:strand:+ start:98 stop:382 length:285 start_codon:yes stop_codon:yes gene_type:complete
MTEYFTNLMIIFHFSQSDTLGKKEIFNVGGNSQNMRKSYIAQLVSDRTGCKLNLRHDKGDPRSYRVNFDKLHNATGELDFIHHVTELSTNLMSF